MSHVFISYSRKDMDAVDRLAERLIAAGIEVWIDREGIRGGEKWRALIVEAIRTADAVLLALSPNSVASDNVRKELDLTEENKKRIIPVEFAQTAVPTAIAYQIAGLQKIDLTIDFEEGVRQIEVAIRITIGAEPAGDGIPKTREGGPASAELEWLEKAYTATGSFWSTWAIAALAGIYTRSNIKIPVFGEVTFTEIVVYTLYAFTFGVPLLLIIVWRHRHLQKQFSGRRLLPTPHFPKLGSSGMPPSFRTLAFLGLVVFPIVAQEVAYCRLYHEVCIAWKPLQWWRVEDYKDKDILRKSDLFKFPTQPEPDRDYANWRFMRLTLDKRVMDRKKREPNAEDDDGRDDKDKEKEPVQISAFPGYAPWAFGISACGSALAAGWLLVTRDGSLPGKAIAVLRRQRIYARSKRKRRGRTPPDSE